MLQFDEAFFKGEERDEFYVAPMMKRAWAAQMEVLKVIDDICTKYGLQYFMGWGSLLGAVRHKGFIPWDDDIDVWMKRPDYVKFCEVAQQEFPKGYEILNVHQDEEYDNMLTRVINGRSINIDPEHLELFHGCPYVVGVDIDILDYKSKNDAEDKLQLQLVEIVLQSVGAVEEYENGSITKEKMIAFLSQVEELCGVTLDYNRNIRSQLRQLADRLCMIYQDEDADEWQEVLCRVINRPNFFFPKEWYAEGIRVPFEGVMDVVIPAGWDGLLNLMYGDYMVKNRAHQAHSYPFYKDQEELLRKYLQANHLPMDVLNG